MAEGIFKLVIDEERLHDPDKVCVLQIGGWTHKLTDEDVIKMFFGAGIRVKRSRSAPNGDEPHEPKPKRGKSGTPVLKYGKTLQVRLEVLKLLRKQQLTTTELRARLPPHLASRDVGVVMYTLKAAKLVENDGPHTPWRLIGDAPKRMPRRGR